jgi:hypothetical protein
MGAVVSVGFVRLVYSSAQFCGIFGQWLWHSGLVAVGIGGKYPSVAIAVLDIDHFSTSFLGCIFGSVFSVTQRYPYGDDRRSV